MVDNIDLILADLIRINILALSMLNQTKPYYSFDKTVNKAILQKKIVGPHISISSGSSSK